MNDHDHGEDITARGPLPDGLSDLAPGPSLASTLATIDPTRCNGAELVDLVTAQHRQLCYEQGRLLDMLHELAHTPPAESASSPVRLVEADPHARSEVAFALTWTEYAAGSALDLARCAVATAPALRREMAHGRLDMDKLKVIASELDAVEQAAARAVVDHLIPDIGRCTTGQLRQMTRQLVLQVAPDAAGARYSAALKRRRVQCTEFPNGTTCLSGIYLGPAEAAAAWENIDAIARATKAAGDPLGRGMDQIRADVFTDLLAGVDPARAGGAKPAERRGVVNVHIDLETLAGWSRQPGRIDGFGPVLSEIARQTVEQVRERAEWRFTTHDGQGQAIAVGQLRYRPTVAQRRFVEGRDVTCMAPGCRMPATRCDLDHVIDRARYGLTTIDNLVPLCRRHHRAKHKGGHRIRRTALGLEWITPRRKRYLVIPHGSEAPSELECLLERLAQAENIMSRLRR